MKTTLAPRSSELEFLAGLLDQAAHYAQAKIDAIPEDVGIEHESDEIAAVIAPAAAIAGHMVSLSAKGERDVRAKARAMAWLDGRYQAEFAQAA